MIDMELLFRRKSDVKIKNTLAKIREQDAIITKANKRIETLEKRLKKLNVEYFWSKEILEEEEERKSYGLNYSLTVQLTGIIMQSRAYPNAHDDGKTFIATIDDKYCTVHYPDWYQEQRYPKIMRGIKTFEEAKKISLEWMKEVIEYEV